MKHTPGPWEISYDKGSGRDIVASPDPLPICTVRISWVGHEQYHANASLIASAPELLDALKHTAEALAHCLGESNANVQEARAAIQKATGAA